MPAMAESRSAFGNAGVAARAARKAAEASAPAPAVDGSASAGSATSAAAAGTSHAAATAGGDQAPGAPRAAQAAAVDKVHREDKFLSHTERNKRKPCGTMQRHEPSAYPGVAVLLFAAAHGALEDACSLSTAAACATSTRAPRAAATSAGGDQAPGAASTGQPAPAATSGVEVDECPLDMLRVRLWDGLQDSPTGRGFFRRWEAAKGQATAAAAAASTGQPAPAATSGMEEDVLEDSPASEGFRLRGGNEGGEGNAPGDGALGARKDRTLDMLRTRLEKRDHMRTLPPSDADLLQASRCPISALHLLHNNSGLGDHRDLFQLTYCTLTKEERALAIEGARERERERERKREFYIYRCVPIRPPMCAPFCLPVERPKVELPVPACPSFFFPFQKNYKHDAHWR